MVRLSIFLIISALLLPLACQKEKEKYSKLDPRVRKLLEKAESPEPKVQIEALIKLGKMGEKARPAAPYLIDQLRGDNANPLYVAKTLKKIEFTSFEPFYKLLKEGNDQSQINAVLALGHLGQEARPAAKAVIKAAETGSDELRLQAIATLNRMKIEDQKFIPLLEPFLKDPLPQVSLYTAFLLGEMGYDGKEMEAVLIKALEGEIKPRINFPKDMKEEMRKLKEALSQSEAMHNRLEAAQILLKRGREKKILPLLRQNARSEIPQVSYVFTMLLFKRKLASEEDKERLVKGALDPNFGPKILEGLGKMGQRAKAVLKRAEKKAWGKRKEKIREILNQLEEGKKKEK